MCVCVCVHVCVCEFLEEGTSALIYILGQAPHLIVEWILQVAVI